MFTRERFCDYVSDEIRLIHSHIFVFLSNNLSIINVTWMNVLLNNNCLLKWKHRVMAFQCKYIDRPTAKYMLL